MANHYFGLRSFLDPIYCRARIIYAGTQYVFDSSKVPNLDPSLDLFLGKTFHLTVPKSGAQDLARNCDGSSISVPDSLSPRSDLAIRETGVAGYIFEIL